MSPICSKAAAAAADSADECDSVLLCDKWLEAGHCLGQNPLSRRCHRSAAKQQQQQQTQQMNVTVFAVRKDEWLEAGHCPRQELSVAGVTNCSVQAAAAAHEIDRGCCVRWLA
jgi:hypothetical protein